MCHIFFIHSSVDGHLGCFHAEIKSYRHTFMPICLCIVYGCFQATMIELNSWAIDHLTCKAENIYHLDFNRKSVYFVTSHGLYLSLLYLMSNMEPLQTMQFLEHATLSLTPEHLHVPSSRGESFFAYSSFWWLQAFLSWGCLTPIPVSITM